MLSMICPKEPICTLHVSLIYVETENTEAACDRPMGGEFSNMKVWKIIPQLSSREYLKIHMLFALHISFFLDSCRYEY